ncbi:MAG: hypothetical protein LBR74_04610 [Eubacterium sp.]|jgi:hypothetical protein|nr:hypothetical protein [Eubacterium sp.]
MNRGLFFGLLGIIALISGAIISIVLLKHKFNRRDEYDFEEFNDVIDDEEFEHFFDGDGAFMDNFEEEEDNSDELT